MGSESWPNSRWLTKPTSSTKIKHRPKHWANVSKNFYIEVDENTCPRYQRRRWKYRTSQPIKLLLAIWVMLFFLWYNKRVNYFIKEVFRLVPVNCWYDLWNSWRKIDHAWKLATTKPGKDNHVWNCDVRTGSTFDTSYRPEENLNKLSSRLSRLNTCTKWMTQLTFMNTETYDQYEIL